MLVIRGARFPLHCPRCHARFVKLDPDTGNPIYEGGLLLVTWDVPENWRPVYGDRLTVAARCSCFVGDRLRWAYPYNGIRGVGRLDTLEIGLARAAGITPGTDVWDAATDRSDVRESTVLERREWRETRMIEEAEQEGIF